MKKLGLLLLIFFSLGFGFAKELYWENPAAISDGDSRFPKSVTNGSESCVLWQEIDTKKKEIWLSAVYYSEIDKPVTQKRFAGPVKYSGDIPDIYSATMRSDGSVYVALLSGVSGITIYSSSAINLSFSKMQEIEYSSPLVAPRLFVTANNSLRLFATLAENESFYIMTCESVDGRRWSDFAFFTPSQNHQNPFVPNLIPYGGGDLVVFQSQFLTGTRISYQLYGTYSKDNGKTWSEAVLLTGQESLTITDTRAFSSYQNQQPSLYNCKGEVYMAWERTHNLSENANLWIAKISPAGIDSASAEQLTFSGNAARAKIFSFDNVLSVVWFDTRTGSERVYVAQKNGAYWDEESLSINSLKNMFAVPVLSNDGSKLSFVWEQTSRKNTYSIIMLKPDTTVNLAKLVPLSFKEGKHSQSPDVKVRISFPEDSSGISGYSYIWSQDKNSEPTFESSNVPSKNILNLKADKDGDWFLNVRVFDYAGNASGTATLLYNLDITPPKKPTIVFNDLDKFGFASTNSISINLYPDEGDTDIGGYSYSFDYVAAIPKKLNDNSYHPLSLSEEETLAEVENINLKYEKFLDGSRKIPSRIMSEKSNINFPSQSNGVYIFTAAAIDEVGNISEKNSCILILNKFMPRTFITSTKTFVNELGEISLEVLGGGYTYDGTISQIYIDRDGAQPYDMILNLSDGNYKVSSDDRITNIRLGNDLDEGNYRVGLVHTDRGLYMSGKILQIEQNGTVKIEPQISFTPNWKVYKNPHKFRIYVNYVLLAFIMILSVSIIIFAAHGFASSARESVMVRKEIIALMTGDIMPTAKNAQALKQKGVSLKLKLVSFTSALVMAIIALVAVPLGYIMTNMQERTLSRGLQQRVEVLLESLSSGARAYMPLNNILELSYLPDQATSMDEVKYATIIGEPSESNRAGLNYVWASNDDNITEKIDTETVHFGQSKIIEDVVLRISDECAKLNENAVNTVGSIAQNISELNAEGVSLALRNDAKSVERREEIASITTELNGRLTSSLSDIAKAGVSSYPKFNADFLDRETTDYLFYRPVLFRQGTSHNYVHGVILLEVSTQTLIDEANKSRDAVLITAAAVALLAVLIGAILSFILASIIIKPIKKLAAYVKIIGDTKDKAKLKGKDFKITTKDEIGQLGEVINDMTGQLARAAEDEKLSLDGKAVQNAFLPLLAGKTKTQTVAKLDEANVECFGYYEGASGVSGDYFDYKKLDNRWYSIIKCDASGHGVPAALIMTVVATMFREYFGSWSFAEHGIQLNVLVTKINDALESLGLKGKFAAMIVCLLDTKTGDVYMCNAGDNIVHIYDSSEKKEKILTLAETPAAGPLPSFMVDMKGGFRVEKTTLKKGDVLFLYTDGIEESTRLCRRHDFSVIKDEKTEPDGNISQEDRKEQLEPERVQAVIESVFTKHKFILTKKDNPIVSENLEFDFTNCAGTLEEVILALASVEKIFRMYKTPTSSSSDSISVDKRIDEFLRAHFNRYDYYCSNHVEGEEENYIEYTNVLEDEQLDDLTLLAVRLK